jgi:hypothetical protein
MGGRFGEHCLDMIDCDRVAALINGADGLFGYKSIKYLQKITAVDSLKNVGDGRGSPLSFGRLFVVWGFRITFVVSQAFKPAQIFAIWWSSCSATK